MTIDERLAKMMQTLQLRASRAAEEQKRHEELMAAHPQQLTKVEQSHAKTERALRLAIESCAREKRNDGKRQQELAAAADRRHQELSELADRRHQELEGAFQKFMERSGTASIDPSAGALSYGKRGRRTMTFEERLEAMAQTLELQVSLQADEKKRTDVQLALHERQIALHEQQMALHKQQMALHEQRMGKLDQEHDKTERTLRWAIRLGVREARNERKRRQELAKGHQELESMFKKFLERSGNGQH